MIKMKGHKGKMKWHKREHERKKIAQHKPRFNKSSGGEGRPAKGGSGRRSW